MPGAVWGPQILLSPRAPNCPGPALLWPAVSSCRRRDSVVRWVMRRMLHTSLSRSCDCVEMWRSPITHWILTEWQLIDMRCPAQVECAARDQVIKRCLMYESVNLLLHDAACSYTENDGCKKVDIIQSEWFADTDRKLCWWPQPSVTSITKAVRGGLTPASNLLLCNVHVMGNAGNINFPP